MPVAVDYRTSLADEFGVHGTLHPHRRARSYLWLVHVDIPPRLITPSPGSFLSLVCHTRIISGDTLLALIGGALVGRLTQTSPFIHDAHSPSYRPSRAGSAASQGMTPL